MATLTNKTIASTYTSLLKLEGDTGSTVAGNGSNAVQVKTGDNAATPLYLNTNRLGIDGQPNAKLDISGDTGTWAGMAKVFLTDVNSNSDSRNWSIGNGGTAYGALSFIVSNAADGVPADSTGTAVMVLDGVISAPCFIIKSLTFSGYAEAYDNNAGIYFIASLSSENNPPFLPIVCFV